ncbi:MAG TPA: isochorismatase family protein [Eoetvoesiella sp.]
MTKSQTAPWAGIISQDEEDIYRQAGFGVGGGLGLRPALLIIDVQYRTLGHEPLPLPQALQKFPTNCGESGWLALPNISAILDCFRQEGWPVFHPHVAPKSVTDSGRLAAKAPLLMAIGKEGYEIVAEVAPIDGEVPIPKKHPSAFFGTALISHLIDQGVDTLVITGCTTSGCVRASVTDAFAYNFRVIVPQDAVFDRCQTSHAVNLFDMAQKFADVLPTAEVLLQLNRLR